MAKRSGARLGQHFLKHAWAARALAHAARVRPGDTILEIGPGKGVLTRELLAFGPVVAIEKDESLVTHMRETFTDEIKAGKLRIISADVRDTSPESLGLGHYVLATNIPYYITGEIIRQFLTAESQPHTMALLVQKEVAQRITSSRESILSLSVKAYGVPKIIEKVSRTHFSPPPTVDSAILVITDISKTFFDTITEDAFFRVVHAGFASKRKMLANNLSTKFGKEVVMRTLATADINVKARAENVPLEKWKVLTQLLSTRAHHAN